MMAPWHDELVTKPHGGTTHDTIMPRPGEGGAKLKTRTMGTISRSQQSLGPNSLQTGSEMDGATMNHDYKDLASSHD